MTKSLLRTSQPDMTVGGSSATGTCWLGSKYEWTRKHSYINIYWSNNFRRELQLHKAARKKNCKRLCFLTRMYKYKGRTNKKLFLLQNILSSGRPDSRVDKWLPLHTLQKQNNKKSSVWGEIPVWALCMKEQKDLD